MEFVPDRLKALLEINRTVISDLAEEMDVSRQMIHRWLNGKKIPNTPHILFLCKKFDVDITYFFPTTDRELVNA